MGVYKVTIVDLFSLSKFNGTEKVILLDIRLPRVILAGLVGAALSGAGATLQGLFRNPLVDPYILGISSGAAFGCAISVAFFPTLPVQPLAFLFGLGAILLTYSIAMAQGGVSNLPLILAGIVISAFFTALVSVIKFLVDPHKLVNIVYWLMGSFSLADWKGVGICSLGVLLGCVPMFLMRWRLNVISMGEEEAKSLGISIEKERAILVATSSLAVATAVSVSGIIGWVGLMVPHLVRMAIGADHKYLIPLSFSVGASFMILADTLARNLVSFEIPVGVITAICGAPFFIYIMKKGNKGWNGD